MATDGVQARIYSVYIMLVHIKFILAYFYLLLVVFFGFHILTTVREPSCFAVNILFSGTFCFIKFMMNTHFYSIHR